MLTAIDQIANRSHLQLFKAMIPYLPRERQGFFSCYVKFLELQNVMSFFSAGQNQLQSCTAGQEDFTLSQMFSDLREYCDEGEREMMDQMANLFTTMEVFAMMSEMGDDEDE